MTEYWWRSWHGAPMDHKWSVIAARSGVKAGIVSAVAWALIDYASQHQIRGTVEGFDVEMYSVYSGFEETEISAVIKAMTDKGIIVDGRLANWEKRQPKREDDSRERVRNHREMKRNVTQGNAPDTEEDTESETDKETEIETEEERTPSPFSDDIQAETIFHRASGMPTIPGKSEDKQAAIGAIRAIRCQKKTDNDTVVYLQPFYKEWRARGYSPSNCAWLTDWAVSGSIPEARKTPAPPMDAETARLARQRASVNRMPL